MQTDVKFTHDIPVFQLFFAYLQRSEFFLWKQTDFLSRC